LTDDWPRGAVIAAASGPRGPIDRSQRRRRWDAVPPDSARAASLSLARLRALGRAGSAPRAKLEPVSVTDIRAFTRCIVGGEAPTLDIDNIVQKKIIGIQRSGGIRNCRRSSPATPR